MGQWVNERLVCRLVPKLYKLLQNPPFSHCAALETSDTIRYAQLIQGERERERESAKVIRRKEVAENRFPKKPQGNKTFLSSQGHRAADPLLRVLVL